MKKLTVFTYLVLVIIGCTTDNKSELENDVLSEQSLIGTWSWQTAQVTNVSTQATGTFDIGSEDCYESEVGFLAPCEGIESRIIEDCRTFQRFEITFKKTNTYDQNENYTHNREEVEDLANCNPILYNNEPFGSFSSGSWTIQDETIVLSQTYLKTQFTFFDEERISESLDGALQSWRVLSFSPSEMTIFWRTPDQADFEITFLKK